MLELLFVCVCVCVCERERVCVYVYALQCGCCVYVYALLCGCSQLHCIHVDLRYNIIRGIVTIYVIQLD